MRHSVATDKFRLPFSVDEQERAETH